MSFSKTPDQSIERSMAQPWDTLTLNAREDESATAGGQRGAGRRDTATTGRRDHTRAAEAPGAAGGGEAEPQPGHERRGDKRRRSALGGRTDGGAAGTKHGQRHTHTSSERHEGAERAAEEATSESDRREATHTTGCRHMGAQTPEGRASAARAREHHAEQRRDEQRDEANAQDRRLMKGSHIEDLTSSTVFIEDVEAALQLLEGLVREKVHCIHGEKLE
ncbi:hypothetical protein OSTOST_03290 [Ostertagia ostertagi]